MNEHVKLSIIVPCYKGEAFIVESIVTIENIVSTFIKDFELIVVIDGFIDKGYDNAKPLEIKYKNLIVTGYEKNKGKGYALLHGFGKSSGDLVAFLDSDMDYDPNALKWFLDIITHKDADIVIGNRKDRNSTYVYPFVRKISSWAFNRFVKLIFPEIQCHDTQAGIKLMKRELAERYFENVERNTDLQGFILDVYLLLIANGLNMKVVSSHCIFEMKSSTIGTGGSLIRTAYLMGSGVLTLKRRYKADHGCPVVI